LILRTSSPKSVRKPSVCPIGSTRIEAENLVPDTQEAWEATHVCGSAAEKIYTGCERVMARLAAEVDQTPVVHPEGWHAALVRRMANPFPGVRGPIISRECHGLLDKLRAFRHRERNTYGINLDLEVVVERGNEAVSIFYRFRQEVRAFLSHGNNDDPHRIESSDPKTGIS
jgi:hypothetical protein